MDPVQIQCGPCVDPVRTQCLLSRPTIRVFPPQILESDTFPDDILDLAGSAPSVLLLLQKARFSRELEGPGVLERARDFTAPLGEPDGDHEGSDEEQETETGVQPSRHQAQQVENAATCS